MARCSNHPHVVKFVGACADNNQFWCVQCVLIRVCARVPCSIVTELLRCSVYDALVVRKEPFSVADTMRMLHQVRLCVRVNCVHAARAHSRRVACCICTRRASYIATSPHATFCWTRATTYSLGECAASAVVFVCV
jgi:hypothetical protein